MPRTDTSDSAPVRWRIKDNEARQFVYRMIMARRLRNKMARSRGFRNYAEMCGDE